MGTNYAATDVTTLTTRRPQHQNTEPSETIMPLFKVQIRGNRQLGKQDGDRSGDVMEHTHVKLY